MNIILAQHHGMCFGVRDALRATHAAAQRSPLTILGQLVHNPLVDRHLATLGTQRGDLDDLRGELGDLLFQVVFHARMAEEQGAFAFDDVAAAMVEKMIRRHPHVFSGQTYADLAEQTAAWETIKAEERAAKNRAASLLDDVPASLPGLTRAVKLTKRAARVGFDWPGLEQVLSKLREELEELQVEIDAGDLPKARAELGDLLFVCANLARKLDVDPEDSLRAANAKFVRRFGYIEKVLAERGSSPDQSNLEEMDALWDEAKAQERKAL